MAQYETATSRKQYHDRGERWSEEGSVKLYHCYEKRKRISPPEPWRLLCSIHQQAWGGKA